MTNPLAARIARLALAVFAIGTAPTQASAQLRHPRTTTKLATVALHTSGEVAASKTRAPILTYPPKPSVEAPVTVIYLHGIQGRPEHGCQWFEADVTEIGWLVCPAANQKHPNGTFSWSGSASQKRETVARAEAAPAFDGTDAHEHKVIVGFSQGAYVALDLVRARLGRYRGLVLIGAEANVTRAELEAAGVSRLVLAAGRYDATFAPLERAATRLRKEGMAVRFIDLGTIGHSYVAKDRQALHDAIGWASGRSS